jgi:selenocysteine-specific elongation factor
MPHIIGTAGHIDHGKTSLIKALTGQDTDRLKEEKERGISIDLGFAYIDLPDGSRAGIVDVPGHERFIRNMLAGAHGIDLALFTVAADDGVMPQTEEHLDILHLLGIKRAIFVVTKTDLVGVQRIRDVEEDIRTLTLGTSLENSPIAPFSFVTGEGLEDLKARMARILRETAQSKPAGYFRLPVDRAFSLAGHGLIVTGTAQSGEVHVGDRVRALPGDEVFRVRSIQVHNEAVESATWGQRVALNLSGGEGAAIERGHVICHERITRTTDRFDAFLEVRPGAGAGIKSHQRVRLHLGAAERMGKLILLGSEESVRPKESVFCQITTSDPLLALRGDRFVIRDETARHTLGGGVIIHPWPGRHKKGEAGLQATLELLHRGDLSQVATRFIDSSPDFALAIAPLYQSLNIREEQARELVERMEGIRGFSFEGDALYTTQRKWTLLGAELLERLKEHHAAHPVAAGMEMEQAREKLSFELPSRVFRAFVEQLEREQALRREGNLLRLPGHDVRIGEKEQSIARKIETLLAANPLAPPDLKQIESESGMERAKFSEIIRLMEREKVIVRVAADMVFLRAAIEQVRHSLTDYLAKRQQITAAEFRDLLGTTRKYTIPLLEYFDREGTTIRFGDVRRLRRPAKV